MMPEKEFVPVDRAGRPLKTMASRKPSRKVQQGGVGGAVAMIVMFFAAQFDIVIPAHVAGAFVLVATFVSSYFTRDRADA